jgi:hypothetical protein
MDNAGLFLRERLDMILERVEGLALACKQLVIR